MDKATLINFTNNPPLSSSPSLDDADPTPRMNLNNVDGVRREMSRVYRDMRSGSIATQDGTRLIYVLSELRKMFEVCDLERRIELLEITPQIGGEA
jgi:hypothetical protein